MKNKTTKTKAISRIVPSSNKQKPTPNDNRSITKNPNNPQYGNVQGNRGKQLNPNQKDK